MRRVPSPSAQKKSVTEKPNITRKAVLARIARVEGQFRGIRRMVEQRDECLNIIAQISAIREAIAMLGVELLKDDFVCKWEGKKKIDEVYLKSLFKMQ
jgi:DNA-binding FrmR family transcriptional regulator